MDKQIDASINELDTAFTPEDIVEPSLNNTTEEQNVNQWQRISPIAMVYFVIKFIYALFGNVIYIAPAILVGYKQILANPHIWLPVAVVVLALIALGTFLNFYFFQYRLTDDHIEIRSGVFAKKHVNLPFTRIQNVKLEQPIYYRPFNYTCLQLDTAGSAKQEAKVVALKVEFAEQLKKEILASHKLATANESILNDNISALDSNTSEQSINQSVEKISENEVVLNRRSVKDLVIHGLTNNRIWIFIGGMAPFFEQIGRGIVDFFNALGIDIENLLTIADKPWWQIGLYALTLTFLVMLAISLFSVAGSIISFYNYTLSKTADRYIRRSGLLTKHEVSMRLSRLQMVVRQQDWLDLLLKRINLKFEQSNANMQDFQPGAQNNKIIVPSIKPEQCQELIADVYPKNQLMTIDYQGISKHFLIRNILYIITPLVLSLSAFVLFIDKAIALYVIVPVFALLSVMVIFRWLRWGFASDENYLYIRKGMFGVDYYCFPRYKVQQTTFKQSWFLRKRQLASVRFVLAAGGQNIPFIPQVQAYQLIDNALFEVESTRKSWM